MDIFKMSNSKKNGKLFWKKICYDKKYFKFYKISFCTFML